MNKSLTVLEQHEGK